MKRITLKFNDRQGNESFAQIQKIASACFLTILQRTNSIEHSEKFVTIELEGTGEAIEAAKQRLVRFPAISVKREGASAMANDLILKQMEQSSLSRRSDDFDRSRRSQKNQ